MYKVKVENSSQLEVVLASKDICEVILARDSFAEKDLQKLIKKVKTYRKKASILMERISRYEELNSNINAAMNNLRLATDKIFEWEELDGIIIQNMDSFAYMLRRINRAKNRSLYVELNYTMNCYNIETKKVYNMLYNERRENAEDLPLRFTAPIELNAYELSDVQYDTYLVYGYLDTMVSANCLRKNTKQLGIQRDKDNRTINNGNFAKHYSVNRRNSHIGHIDSGVNGGADNCICENKFNFNKVREYTDYIKDRKNKKLYYKAYCKFCYNKIFNVDPLYLLDGMLENNTMIMENQPLFRIDFTFENAKEVSEILAKKMPTSFTRGHIKNSIN